MKFNRSTWILSCVLAGFFLAGFLTGLTVYRPIKEVFPKRTPAEDPIPEDFVRNFQRRMTENLHLTEDQQQLVEEKIVEMTRRIRSVQREFLPQINKALLDSIDEILPLLDEEQKKILQDRRRNIERSSRGGAGFTQPPPGTFGPGGPGSGGRPPWGDGPPPWGDGPPPWGDGPPPWGDGPPPWNRNDQ